MIPYQVLRSATMRVYVLMERHRGDAVSAAGELGFDPDFLNRFSKSLVRDAGGIMASKDTVAQRAFVAGVLLGKELA